MEPLVRYFVRSYHRSLHLHGKMPKATGKTKGKATGTAVSTSDDNPVFLNNKGVLCLRILAKPGAKINSIQGLTSEGVGVQIAAPPVDGDANVELIKYMAKVLGIRKSDLSLERGARSRNKLLEVVSSDLTVDGVKQKLEKEITSE